MPSWMRAFGLTALCTVCGFGGGLAGVAVADRDTPAEVSSPTGEVGPAGPQGPRGPQGPAGQVADLSGIEAALMLLEGRMDSLESGPGGCNGIVTTVVTDIDAFGEFDPSFDVRKTPYPVCLQSP